MSWPGGIRKMNSDCKYVGKISFKNALKMLSVNLSCNMKFYLTNQNEIEVDLNHKVRDLDLNDKERMDKLEQEHFYKQL